ncbi:MAG: DUF1559 domain-containing protein, partial [Pirellulales bacterium]|nr:DUF1559 domain-containing protein [Pirellulales bacterium]
GDDPGYPWPDWIPGVTGVSFVRSRIKVVDITDGTNNTYLGGEKAIHPDQYLTGRSWGDDNNPFVGHDWDIMRWASSTYHLQPDHRLDNTTAQYAFYFGAAHPTVCHMLFCDGSVHGISYDVDPVLHARLGNRADGYSVDKSEIVP